MSLYFLFDGLPVLLLVAVLSLARSLSGSDPKKNVTADRD